MGAFGVGRAKQKAWGAAAHPAYGYAIRAGYVARGVLYGYMGFAALRVALTAVPQRADQQASLLVVAGVPLGRWILVAGIVALAAYSIWGFVRAILDPLNRGDDATGVVTRLGFAWSGLCYGALCVFTVALLGNSAGGAGGGDQFASLTGKVLAAPAGVWLTIVAGLVGIAAGLGQFYEAYRAAFERDEKRGEMSEAEKKVTDFLGRAGFVARGVVFTLMGWFILLAGFFHDSGKATGYTGVFSYLLHQPFGRPLLALVAAGFVALGLHSVVLARYIRLPGDSGS